MLDARDDFSFSHLGSVNVLDDLVADTVNLVRLGHDTGWDEPGWRADFGGGEGATLPTQQHVLALFVAVDRDGLQDAALLDGFPEILVCTQIGSHVAAQNNRCGIEINELLGSFSGGRFVGGDGHLGFSHLI